MTYKKSILKFSAKKLAHLKMPTTRKRDLVEMFAFALMVKHRKQGVPTNFK